MNVRNPEKSEESVKKDQKKVKESRNGQNGNKKKWYEDKNYALKEKSKEDSMSCDSSGQDMDE